MPDHRESTVCKYQQIETESTTTEQMTVGTLHTKLFILLSIFSTCGCFSSFRILFRTDLTSQLRQLFLKFGRKSEPINLDGETYLTSISVDLDVSSLGVKPTFILSLAPGWRMMAMEPRCGFTPSVLSICFR